MTTRTYRHFACPNGHVGEERTSENDQPYSTMWESVKLKGLRARGKDERGYQLYTCTECGEYMVEKADQK